MPENLWIINEILNSYNKKIIKNSINDLFITPSSSKISVEESEKIKNSLVLFGFQKEDWFIETLFARWYLDKIIGNEQKLIALKEVWFQLDSVDDIGNICHNSVEHIHKSIDTFESLREKLVILQDIWFRFNGTSFPYIQKIPEVVDKIIRLKEKLILLKPFWIELDLKDREFFNVDEETLDQLIHLQEKLKLAWKITLRISLQNICLVTITENKSKKSKWIDEFTKIKSETFEIINQKNINTHENILNFDIIYWDKDYSYGKKIKEWVSKKILSILDDSNYSNPSFLDTLDETIFDAALQNIDLLSTLLKKIWIVIDIKKFLKLSYLFDKPEVMKNMIKLMEADLWITPINLEKNQALFLQLDDENTSDIIQMRAIHNIEVFDEINLITNVISNRENVKAILENKEKYTKLVWLYKTTFWGEERLFQKWIFTQNLTDMLFFSNFDELEWAFKEITNFVETHSFRQKHNNMFNGDNISFFMKIGATHPWDVTTLILTFFQHNFSIEFIDFLKKQNIAHIRDFLQSLDIEFLINNNKYCNEYILLLQAFWLEVHAEIKKVTYAYNIVQLLSGISPQNITSLDAIFNKLKKTWFWEWKISKDNITEIWALTKSEYDDTNLSDEHKQVNENIIKISRWGDIESYKQIIRSLWDYIYSKDIEEDFSFQDLLEIFGRTFHSDFLKTLHRNTGSESFKYLLSKKARLQDIEKAYNNYPDLFSLDLNNEYYKFCLDYALEHDNYDYLSQNIETINYLTNSWKLMHWLWIGNAELKYEWSHISNIVNNILNYIEPKNIKSISDILLALKEILTHTWGYLTISMINGYIEDGKSLEGLLKESLEAKKEVLSPNPITHFNLATYETIFLAYRPTGYTIDSIRYNIENRNISDMSHHLEWIQYNLNWYDMEFFQRSYHLQWSQNATLVNGIDQLLRWNKVLLNIEKLWDEDKNSYSLFQWLNTKLFFTTSTNLFHWNKNDSKLNDWIFNILREVYALNNDARIEAYKYNFVDGNFTYERLSELREIFSVVTKDSFDSIIWEEIWKLGEEKQISLWENIWKLKDKNLKTKYEEIEAKDITLEEKIKELFMWRFLGYASQIRKYISAEMKKFSEVKGKQTPVKAVLSKNIWSFFAKAGAWLCTSENFEMWQEKRHIHLNLVDEQKQEIIGNVMLYFEAWRNYLIARGFNPRTDIESTYEVHHMVDEMIRVVKEIAVQNGYVDEHWEALVYIPPQDSTHLVSNRETVRKRISYIVGKVNKQIHDTNFSGNKIWFRVCQTLHRI